MLRLERLMEWPFPCLGIRCMRLLVLSLIVLSNLHLSAAADTLPPVNPVITIGQGVTNEQGSVSLEIALTAPNGAVAALQFDIVFQTQILGLSVSSGRGANDAAKSLLTSDPQPGTRRILVSGLNQNTIGAGVIAVLSIQTNSDTAPGHYPMMLTNLVAVDALGSFVPLGGVDGGVVVPGNQILAPTVTSVANAACYASGVVSPGEIVVIGGSVLGSNTGANLQITSDGTVAAALAGTRVLFDDIPAPLVYVTSSQVSAIVPYELDGLSRTSLQVEYQGIRSAPFLLPIIQAGPGIFTLNASGTGQGAILNQDGSVNGPQNPAARGSVVSVFATGEGQTSPPGVDGSIVPASGLRHPAAPVTASIGGQQADVVYAGSAGGQVSGLFQANLRVPSSLPAGPAAVTLTVGLTSQPGVTVALQE
jgi:uncharacterized protein (TIGR03437 family)